MTSLVDISRFVISGEIGLYLPPVLEGSDPLGLNNDSLTASWRHKIDAFGLDSRMRRMVSSSPTPLFLIDFSEAAFITSVAF